jgi:hypothetical protein
MNIGTPDSTAVSLKVATVAFSSRKTKDLVEVFWGNNNNTDTSTSNVAWAFSGKQSQNKESFDDILLWRQSWMMEAVDSISDYPLWEMCNRTGRRHSVYLPDTGFSSSFPDSMPMIKTPIQRFRSLSGLVASNRCSSAIKTMRAPNRPLRSQPIFWGFLARPDNETWELWFTWSTIRESENRGCKITLRLQFAATFWHVR